MFASYFDCTVLVNLKAKANDFNIVKVYEPRSNRTDDEVEQFYKEIKKLLKLRRKHNVNIRMGNFNATIENEKFGEIIISYGIGTINKRDYKLLQLYPEEEEAFD